METLTEYRRRTAFMWDSLPRSGGIATNPNLLQKADEAGCLLPFWGDTVIFDLPSGMKDWLAGIQAALYEACGAYLAEPLSRQSLHITLHDLQSSPRGWPSGLPGNQKRAETLLAAARQELPGEVTVRSGCVFSMVNTSIVMGFEPAAEQDQQLLMTLYDRFQRIRPLGYPLTLHATLAYYRPGVYGEEALCTLRRTLDGLARERREWRLLMSDLHYATFDSMARYVMV
jgi:hypothetical protein